MNTPTENDIFEVNLGEIGYNLVHKFWMILIAGVICVIPFFIYMVFFSTPVYTSTTSFLIYVQEDLNAEYCALATTSEVIGNSLEELQLDYSEDELRKKINAWVQDDAKIMFISVSDQDPGLAKLMAETVRDYTIDLVKRSRGIEHTRVLIEANFPKYVSGISFKKMAAAGIAGAFFAFCCIVWMTLRRDTICTPDEVERYMGLETLGIIPLDNE